MKPSTEKAIGIPIICVLTLVPPIVVAAVSPIQKSEAWKTNRPAIVPPAAVFPVVWTLLYVAAAVALILQVFWSTKQVSAAVKWTAVALVCAQLIIGYVWPVVWNDNKPRAATYMILGMIALLIPGIVLTTKVNIASAALWSPMLAWLIFALLLSAESVRQINV